MKLTVINSNSRLRLALLSSLALAVHGYLVVDTELTLRHPGQVGLHQDLASHVRRQHLALGTHQQVDILNDIQEQLIPPVLDPLPPPAYLTSHLARDGRLLLLGGGLDALLRDEGLEDASVRVLRIAEVNDLIKNLIDQDKVVLHVLLADLAEVVLHHLDKLQQELEHHGGVHVLLGHRRQPQVRSLDVEV